MLVFSSAYNEYTVISKEYAGPLDFDITGVYCSTSQSYSLCSLKIHLNTLSTGGLSESIVYGI